MDARNELYEPRIKHAQILLENESLQQEIATFYGKGDSDTQPNLADTHAETVQRIDRTEEIIERADMLKANIDAAREELAKKKAVHARRKTKLSAAKSGLETRRARQIEDVEKSTKMSSYKWNKDHSTLAVSRAFLCGEAAKLYGLKRTRRSSGREEFLIGNVSIIDLQMLNSRHLLHVYEQHADYLYSCKSSFYFHSLVACGASSHALYTLSFYSPTCRDNSTSP